MADTAPVQNPRFRARRGPRPTPNRGVPDAPKAADKRPKRPTANNGEAGPEIGPSGQAKASAPSDPGTTVDGAAQRAGRPRVTPNGINAIRTAVRNEAKRPPRTATTSVEAKPETVADDTNGNADPEAVAIDAPAQEGVEQAQTEPKPKRAPRRKGKGGKAAKAERDAAHLAVVLEAAHTAVSTFARAGVSCATFGSLACRLYGSARCPKDVDLLIYQPPTEGEPWTAELLKKTLLDLDPVHFYLTMPKDPTAEYRVLWLGDHRLAEEAHKRRKLPQDAADIKRLLSMREKLDELGEEKPWSDRIMFSEEFEELTRRRVKDYCEAYPKHVGKWRALGFEVPDPKPKPKEEKPDGGKKKEDDDEGDEDTDEAEGEVDLDDDEDEDEAKAEVAEEKLVAQMKGANLDPGR
ncbi:hypothetical protein NMY22_g11322 [Coprinellus aureogranulatus]|nr:hypothetical protein NMY22_g11322 [Coprinellus aureogranulatus]